MTANRSSAFELKVLVDGHEAHKTNQTSSEVESHSHAPEMASIDFDGHQGGSTAYAVKDLHFTASIDMPLLMIINTSL